jgi:hypothetical protein
VDYIADSPSMRRPVRTLLVVDRLHDRSRFLRVTPKAAYVVGNNLGLFNMDFLEFAEVVGDGVPRLRGVGIRSRPITGSTR